MDARKIERTKNKRIHRFVRVFAGIPKPYTWQKRTIFILNGNLKLQTLFFVHEIHERGKKELLITTRQTVRRIQDECKKEKQSATHKKKTFHTPFDRIITKHKRTQNQCHGKCKATTTTTPVAIITIADLLIKTRMSLRCDVWEYDKMTTMIVECLERKSKIKQIQRKRARKKTEINKKSNEKKAWSTSSTTYILHIDNIRSMPAFQQHKKSLNQAGSCVTQLETSQKVCLIQIRTLHMVVWLHCNCYCCCGCCCCLHTFRQSNFYQELIQLFFYRMNHKMSSNRRTDRSATRS